MPLIKVILGSTRPGRFGVKPAQWVMELAKEHPNATFELVDLADINLPLLDEPGAPSEGNYIHQHTKDWSKIIGPADGFVFVVAEYNYSIPAALKNAIDFLANEWKYKPVAFVSYGVDGGIRSVAALRISVALLNMFDLRDEVNFVDYWSQLDDSGKLQPTAKQTEQAHRLLDNITFWADRLKPIREEAEIRRQQRNQKAV